MEQVRGPQRSVRIPVFGLVGSLFDDMCAMACRDSAVDPVEASRAMRDEIAERRMEPGDGSQVANSAEDDRRPTDGQGANQMIEVRLESSAGNSSDHVVGTHRHEDQVRVELEGRGKLVLDEIMDARPTYGQGLECDVVISRETLTDKSNPYLFRPGNTRCSDG
jgi:hypothetical protein